MMWMHGAHTLQLLCFRVWEAAVMPEGQPAGGLLKEVFYQVYNFIVLT